MKECIFCKICSKEAPAYLVYEDEKVAAFLDINPQSEGHTLVVPKKHFENIFDIGEDEIMHLYKIVKKLAIAIKNSLYCSGIRIEQRNGRTAGQVVEHFHTHIIPTPEREVFVSNEKFREVVEKIKSKIED
jgi:histidine triad (HIT) family protein